MSWLKDIFQSGDAPERLLKPPFPPLIRDVFGEDRSLFFWQGEVRLSSWTGFPRERDLTDGFCPDEPAPEGVLDLCVRPVDMAAGSQPTHEQGRAFQHLLDNQLAVRDAVLQGIFDVYGPWRDSYLNTKISSDGGKTYQPASSFPDLFPPENMPEISVPAGLMRIIRPNTVHILESCKDGFAEVGFQFACKWDEEHGLGVLTHKGKVLQVGDASASFEHQ